ncbi:MAG: transporter substrate-binding domain-containing protein [Deinococcus-Thermus bacterium]|nr:transporter substrate-binding domain-containing protein [Deinococcota bacterium]
MRPAFRMMLLVAVLALGFAWSQADLRGRQVRVGVDPTIPPFVTVSASGTLEGLDVDVVTAVCERLGCAPAFVPTTWDRLFPQAAAGEIDVAAAGIWITPERESIVDFSVPYVVSTHAVVTRSSDDPPSQDDLGGGDGSLLLGAEIASTAAQLGRELVGEARLRLYVDAEAARQALRDGDVDGVVIEEVNASRWTETAEDDVIVAVSGLSPVPVGLAFEEGSPLVAAFDAALADLRANGTLDAVVERWLERRTETNR